MSPNVILVTLTKSVTFFPAMPELEPFSFGALKETGFVFAYPSSAHLLIDFVFPSGDGTPFTFSTFRGSTDICRPGLIPEFFIPAPSGRRGNYHSISIPFNSGTCPPFWK